MKIISIMTTKSNKSIFNKKLLARATKDSVIKLSPAVLIKNPVIFIVGIGATLTTIIVFLGIFQGGYSSFNLQIAIFYGLRYCLPISLKPLPKDVEKHRPKVCVKTARKLLPVKWLATKKPKCWLPIYAKATLWFAK